MSARLMTACHAGPLSRLRRVTAAAGASEDSATASGQPADEQQHTAHSAVLSKGGARTPTLPGSLI